jgi:hypothetical protein
VEGEPQRSHPAWSVKYPDLFSCFSAGIRTIHESHEMGQDAHSFRVISWIALLGKAVAQNRILSVLLVLACVRAAVFLGPTREGVGPL